MRAEWTSVARQCLMKRLWGKIFIVTFYVSFDVLDGVRIQQSVLLVAVVAARDASQVLVASLRIFLGALLLRLLQPLGDARRAGVLDQARQFLARLGVDRPLFLFHERRELLAR